jgi:excisionase family DNA binding protein
MAGAARAFDTWRPWRMLWFSGAMESIETIIRTIVREELARHRSTAATPMSKVPDGLQRLHSIADAAEILSVSTEYVYRAIEAGELSAIDLGHGRAKRRVRASELERFIVSRGS